ncbi:MAG: asparagine synthase-related protein [Phycisphaerales bacterium]
MLIEQLDSLWGQFAAPDLLGLQSRTPTRQGRPLRRRRRRTLRRLPTPHHQHNLNRQRRLLRLIPTSCSASCKPSSRSTYLARLATAARYGGYSELLAIFPTPDIRRLMPEPDGQPSPVTTPFASSTTRSVTTSNTTSPTTCSARPTPRQWPSGSKCERRSSRRNSSRPRCVRPRCPDAQRRAQRLLKQVARKYLPDHIVDRPKQGFAIPIGEWFRSDYGGMRQLLYDHLHSANPFPGLAEAGVELNMKFVEQMLREHDAAGEKSINPWHGRDHSQRLYMLLVLSIWAKWLDRVRSGHEKAHD